MAQWKYYNVSYFILVYNIELGIKDIFNILNKN